MIFIDRQDELNRLHRVMARNEAALVVLWGRRRLGKSRLLTEWCRSNHGVYWVADESAAAIQRQYLAEEIDRTFPGFSAVSYPDWNSLLDRLSREAGAANWHGPLVLDEFPYLIPNAQELPSVLQRWVDREKREGGIVLALSGSSQRMMMNSVLNANAPLYGRADEILKLEPLLPGCIGQAIAASDAHSLLNYYTCWGGVPRYWELAQSFGENYREAVDELVLSPLGVLHDEVDRLLREEMPSAIPLRPILDAIGLGAHKTTEIAGRLQTSATSLSRNLKQLQELGYIRREVPYGKNEKSSKKAIYRLADPFLRLWFRVVAPHRGSLQATSKAARLALLDKVWPQLRAEAWEDLCRLAVPYLRLFDCEWHAAGRHWAVQGSEWDVVSTSLEDVLLLGECKSLARCAESADIANILRQMMSKTPPADLVQPKLRTEYVIFMPEIAADLASLPPNVTVIDGSQIFSAVHPYCE